MTLHYYSENLNNNSTSLRASISHKLCLVCIYFIAIWSLYSQQLYEKQIHNTSHIFHTFNICMLIIIINVYYQSSRALSSVVTVKHVVILVLNRKQHPQLNEEAEKTAAPWGSLKEMVTLSYFQDMAGFIGESVWLLGSVSNVVGPLLSYTKHHEAADVVNWCNIIKIKKQVVVTWRWLLNGVRFHTLLW